MYELIPCSSCGTKFTNLGFSQLCPTCRPEEPQTAIACPVCGVSEETDGPRRCWAHGSWDRTDTKGSHD